MPRVLGDRSRRDGVVARDHDHADTGSPAIGDRLLHVDARRVAKPDQAEEVEAAIAGNGLDRDCALGESKDTQALLGEGSGAPQPFVAILTPEPSRLGLADGGRGGKHSLRRALHRHVQAAAAAMRRRHHLGLGVEGNLIQLGPSLEQGRAV